MTDRYRLEPVRDFPTVQKARAAYVHEFTGKPQVTWFGCTFRPFWRRPRRLVRLYAGVVEYYVTRNGPRETEPVELSLYKLEPKIRVNNAHVVIIDVRVWVEREDVK